MNLLCVILILFPIFANTLPVENDNPSVKEVIDYRLPKSAVPKEYILNLELQNDAFTTDIFSGDVEINFEIIESVSEVTLHAIDLTLKDVIITKAGETENLINAPSASNDVTDFVTLTKKTGNFEIGSYVFKANFEGKFNAADMRGMYKSSYKNENGVEEFLATTQLEPTHARRIFPCFDEPALKATFEVTIIAPKDYTSLANGKLLTTEDVSDNRKKFTFEKSPIMSTYLNAFIISKFKCSENTLDDNTTPHQICSRPEAEAIQEYALNVSPKIMKYLDDFTGIKYTEYGPRKMIQVAIPDFAAGAMENWGLVTYRETNILWDQNDSTNLNKQRLAAVVTHEFAHMWFGNLVTCKWWEDLFLQEGFARYFQYHGTAMVEQNWELEKQFVIEQVQTALSVDQSTSSKALSSAANSPSEVSAKFDSISYNKGAAIYRMIYHLVGEDIFKAGLNGYLTNNANGAAVPTDLWTQFDDKVSGLPDNEKFSTIMNTWTINAGFPVINVKLDGEKVTISQNRFLLSGSDNTKWYTPISYTLSTDINKFTTTPKVWLKPSDNEITLETGVKDWIILNNQQSGYYRVKYDNQLLDKILKALESNINNVNVLNRAQIIDDLFNFAKSANVETTFADVFKNVAFLKKETDYYPWYSAITGFSYVLLKIDRTEIYNQFSGYILELIDTFYKSTPIDQIKESDHIYTLKQALAINWACKLGNKDCIEKSQQLFADYRDNKKKPNVNFRAYVYCTALRHSTNDNDWTFLWNEFKNVKVATEEVIILSALGCTKNENHLETLLREAITKKGAIRKQDLASAFSSVYAGNPSGVSVTYKFVTENWADVVKYYQSESSAVSLIQTLAARFTTKEQITQLEQFINTADLTESSKSSLNSAVTSANKNLDVIKSIETEIENHLGISGGTTVQLSYGLLSVVVVLCCQLFN